MKRSIILTLLFLLIFTTLSAQEVVRGSIKTFGEEHKLDFIEIDGEAYISWTDLNNALPNWFIINDDGEVEISTELLLLLYSAATQETRKAEPSTSGAVIESKIDGEFEGWDGETIFKLINGQIWQQAEYSYTYSYKYRPAVIISQTSSGWIMQVEGISKTIKVKRLK